MNYKKIYSFNYTKDEIFKIKEQDIMKVTMTDDKTYCHVEEFPYKLDVTDDINSTVLIGSAEDPFLTNVCSIDKNLLRNRLKEIYKKQREIENNKISNEKYFIIKDLEVNDYMKDDDGKLELYNSKEEALTVCGMYEFDNALVCKIITKHKE